MHKNLLVILTLMLAGRAMTLAFVHRAGGANPGDPPAAWLMPLLGDAVIGLTALVVAYLLLRCKGLMVWTTVIVWNVLGIWDALSAYIIHLSNPWPEFFMIRIVGQFMFFAAAAMHLLMLYIAIREPVRSDLIGGLPANQT